MEDREELLRRLDEQDALIRQLNIQCASLLDEVHGYRKAARLYGVDPRTMMELAKSKIKTSADNVRIIEKMQEVFELFKYIPEDLTESDLTAALIQYDGDGSKPYCDLVYCGLSIVRKYLKKRSEYDEWRKGNLPENF